MADAFIVQIRIHVLRENFSKADGHEWAAEEVENWLREEGFIEKPDGWICEEIQLEMLDPKEIAQVIPL